MGRNKASASKQTHRHPAAFINVLGGWIGYHIECRKKIMVNRNRLAAMVIKEEGQLFAGIGVYTICEIFHLAGVL